MRAATSARDANDATWYVLRYASDFAERPPDPTVPTWVPPVLDPTLYYDDQRHVLELRPTRPAHEAEPPAGLAVDVDGEVYRVDPGSGRLLVRRCDGSERELVCEPGVMLHPAGLALDRRGYLLAADPDAHRVLVILPDDGTLVAILADGLDEPVDIAAAPDGRLYVADRAAGRVVIFDARFRRRGEFTPRDAEGLPSTPRPIAVMIDADGAILVADANHPRLLRFTPAGEPLADVDLAAAARRAADESPVALAALEHAYGATAPRFLAGACGPCRPARDGGEALAAVHRALRLLLLHLGASYAPSGTFVSAALDAGAPGVQWHRIEIDADLPPGSWLEVQTVTADDVTLLANLATIPQVAEDEDLVTLTSAKWAPYEDPTPGALPRVPWLVPDRLVFSPPGRWLRLRLVLGSNGQVTPSVRSVRIFYPRVSYLDLLPTPYRRDPASAFFLEHFLALFEHVLTDVEDRYERFSRELDVAAAPLDVIDWLACLVDLSFDPSWSLERRRALVAEAIALYRARGTVRGLERYVEIYTGTRPVVLEAFLDRPHTPPFLGRRGSIVGSASALGAPLRSQPPEDALLARFAHRFVVLYYADDECDDRVLHGVVDRIVTVNKPAHTVHTLRAVGADARVGLSRLGLDLMLGAREAGGTRLAGCPAPGAGARRPAALGVDAVLGERRPEYARPLGLTI